MSGQVALSYASTPPELSSQLLPSLKTQLPILNLHWKSSSRSLRTIQSVNVDFEAFPPHFPPEPHLGVTIRPILHVYFVACDDSEVYRTSVRKDIRDWLDQVEKRKHHEWLIVNVVPKGKEGIGRWSRKSGVLDKIKADFNNTKRERCLQISQTGTDWTEFLLKLKESIIVYFDAYVAATEDDIRKQDSQRQIPGWNFCRFFLFKETLALSFESLSLYQDALQCYDELEASFFSALRTSTLSWFDKIGGTTPQDDSSPLLSVTKKPYRDYMLTNQITIFDFRCYLFARQCKLLGRLGRVEEAGRRGEVFISSFARTLRENEASLPKNFIESWIYSGCLNIVEQCSKWGLENGMEEQMRNFGSVKAELLDLARKQLEKVGVQQGHLPNTHPFSVALNEQIPNTASAFNRRFSAPSLEISQKDLIDVINSKEALDRLYLRLTNQAIEAYQESGRTRFALKLHAALAAFQCYRNDFQLAQKHFQPLPAHYVDTRWTAIESSLLRHTCQLQEKLDMPKDRLSTILALLKGTPHDAEQLLVDVKAAAQKLDKDIASPLPVFDIKLREATGRLAGIEDGVFVSLIVVNKLPCAIDTEEVRVKFSTVNGDQVWFSSGNQNLLSGVNHVDVFSASPICGRLHLQLAQIRYSRIVFQYTLKSISKGDNRTQDVFLLRDRDAFDVKISAPFTICLDQKRAVLISLLSGRNHVKRAIVSLNTTEPGVTFKYDEISVLDGKALLHTKRGIEVQGIASFEVVELVIPFTGAPREAVMEVNCAIDYYTLNRPEQRRIIRKMTTFATNLEVAVNVQDFFRTSCLTSRFTIASYTGQSFRIASAAINSNLSQVRPTKEKSGVHTVLGDQTASFLFRFDRPEPSPVVPRFVLRYISVKDELSSTVREVTERFVDRRGLQKYRGLLTEITAKWLESVDTDHYALSNELILPDRDRRLSSKLKLQLSLDDKTVATLISCVEEIRDTLSSFQKFGERDQPWRSLEIPVELPSMTILSVVKMNLDTSSTCEAGVAVSARLVIQACFKWNLDHDVQSADKMTLVYDVAMDPEDWLVTGKKKGKIFVSAADSVENEIRLTLTPLRAGRLFLPAVVVTPLNASVTSETQYCNAVQHVDVRPVTSKTTFFVELTK